MYFFLTLMNCMERTFIYRKITRCMQLCVLCVEQCNEQYCVLNNAVTVRSPCCQYLVFFVFFIQLTPVLGLFSGRLHQVPKQPKLSLTIYILQFFPHFILTIYPNPPCQVFPCGRKPENPEKTYDFSQSVYELFLHERSDTGLEPVTFTIVSTMLFSIDEATTVVHGC